MKSLLSTAIAGALVAGMTLSSGAAFAAKPSSDNTWPGSSQPVQPSTTSAQAAQAHYVWQTEYNRGGKSGGHWVLVD